MTLTAKHVCSDEKCPQTAIPFSNTAEVCSAALSAAGAQNLQNKLSNACFRQSASSTLFFMK